MQIADLSHNDSLETVVEKCNLNFRELAYATRQSIRKMGRQSDDEAARLINDAVASLISTTIPNEVTSQLNAADIPGQVSNEVTTQISTADIPGQVSDAITAADIPGQVSDALDSALAVEMTNTLSDFFVEDGCTVTACNAMRWGDMVFIRLSYRLNSALTVPSNGDITDVTLGTLKIGWRPFDMTNVILDQTRIIVGDVDTNGDVKARSANSRGSSYTIDANAVLYASMTLMIGLQ